MSEFDDFTGEESSAATSGDREYSKAHGTLLESFGEELPQEGIDFDGLRTRFAKLGPALDLVIRGNANRAPSENGTYTFKTSLDHARLITPDSGSLIGMTDGEVVSLFEGPWIDHDPLTTPEPHKSSPESVFLTIPAVIDGWNRPHPEVPSVKLGDEETLYPGRDPDNQLLQLLYGSTFRGTAQKLLWSTRFPLPVESDPPRDAASNQPHSLQVGQEPQHAGGRRLRRSTFDLKSRGRHNRT